MKAYLDEHRRCEQTCCLLPSVSHRSVVFFSLVKLYHCLETAVSVCEQEVRFCIGEKQDVSKASAFREECLMRSEAKPTEWEHRLHSHLSQDNDMALHLRNCSQHLFTKVCPHTLGEVRIRCETNRVGASITLTSVSRQ